MQPNWRVDLGSDAAVTRPAEAAAYLLDCRAAVEVALDLDRSATKLVIQADAQFAAASAALTSSLDASAPDPDLLLSALQLAIGTARFAAGYQDTCRTELTEALDGLGDAGHLPPTPVPDGDWLMSTAAANAVVTQAAAIAAAADASLAAELHAQAVQAATTAHDAVVSAAATVSRAAETARAARAKADALAADGVAALARSTAADMERRAEELALLTADAAAAAAATQAPADNVEAILTARRLAATAAAAAKSKLQETKDAATVVAQAVADAAASIDAITATAAAAAAHDVRHAAAAMQALAEATAGEIAEATARRDDATRDVASARRRPTAFLSDASPSS